MNEDYTVDYDFDVDLMSWMGWLDVAVEFAEVFIIVVVLLAIGMFNLCISWVSDDDQWLDFRR